MRLTAAGRAGRFMVLSRAVIRSRCPVKFLPANQSLVAIPGSWRPKPMVPMDRQRYGGSAIRRRACPRHFLIPEDRSTGTTEILTIREFAAKSNNFPRPQQANSAAEPPGSCLHSAAAEEASGQLRGFGRP